MNITTKGGSFSSKEIQNYVDYLNEKYPNCEVDSLILEEDETDPEYVKMNYTLKNKEETNVPFTRIRRITGYLVGTLDKWNNAKYAEQRDRVKHGTNDPKGIY